MTTSATEAGHPGRTVGPTTEFSLVFRVKPGHAETLRQALEALQNHPGYRPGAWGAETRSSCRGGAFVFVNETAEQVAAVNMERPERCVRSDGWVAERVG